MRILITNNALAIRAGSELYVRDVALALLRRGHQPIAYSQIVGEVAEELRDATVPVVQDLDTLRESPDVIHGHHHLEIMTALLHFPGVPAVAFCHGWFPWQEAPVRFPRIAHYVAVDEPCRERLVIEHGIPEKMVTTILGFVDLARFRRRPPLPSHPGTALLLSHHASRQKYAAPVAEACRRRGIALDVRGVGCGKSEEKPEEILGAYDLVFAKGRAALEAAAVGCAVIVYDARGTGPFVTAAEFDRLHAVSFGARAMQWPSDVGDIEREIARYDPGEATRASDRARAVAGLEPAVDRMLRLYEEALVSSACRRDRESLAAEHRAVAAYLAWLARLVKEREVLSEQRDELAARNAFLAERVAQLKTREEERAATAMRLGAETASLREEARRLRAALAAVDGTLTWRIRRRLREIPGVEKAYEELKRQLAGPKT